MRRIGTALTAIFLAIVLAVSGWADLTPVNVKNGQIIVATDYEEVCPFSVETRSDYSYYVYLKYQKAPSSTTVSRTLKSGASGKQDDISFIVKPNSKVELHVPIGVYKLYYCVGETWYGINDKFGEHTRYYSSEDLLDFYADSQYYQGNSLELWAQTSGNFEDHPITESGFPGTEMSSLNGEKLPDQNMEDSSASSTTGTEPAKDSDSEQDSKMETVTYEDGTYIGELRDGKRHGIGSMVYSDGSAYAGNWEDDQKNGKGTEIYSNGSSYDGEWKDGKWNGYGKMTFTNGMLYEGEWKDGKENGQGIFTVSDKYVIEGEFKNGLDNFQGVITYSDGSTQKAELIDGELILSNAVEGEEESSNGVQRDKAEKSDRTTENNNVASTGVHYKVGDVIEFGSYEQDNDLTNGKEKIEWVILDIRNEEMFLISKYGLDTQKYNNGFTEITWEDCTLRTWLNDFFFEEAFSSDEQRRILSVDIGPVNKNTNGSEHESSTSDKVSLLSSSEVVKYFPPGSTRQCNPTAYAKERGCYENPDSGACSWWLRTPGSSKNAHVIYETDSSTIYGDRVYNNHKAVRPTIWICYEY